MKTLHSERLFKNTPIPAKISSISSEVHISYRLSEIYPIGVQGYRCGDAVPVYSQIIGYKSGKRHAVYSQPSLAYSALLWKSLVRLTQPYGKRLLARIYHCSGSL